jgi:hypothetical protein
MRCERHKSLLYVSVACALTLPVTIAQLLFIDCSTVFVKVTPRIFISVWYVMFRTFVFVLHPSTASSLDFLVFRRSPVAFS